MTDSLPFAGGSDVRALCAECGRTWPIETSLCPSCGAELSGETGAATSLGNTARKGTSRTNAAHTDTELEPKTSVVPRSRSSQDPYATAGSSSDPPTKFLRGVEQHIELPAGCLIDDYEIVSRLGAGAMGVVYCAQHTKLDRQVALKVIAPSMGDDPRALARFAREAKALASLKHPNIVDVYAFGTLPDERSYFAMEFLSGSTLDEKLARGRVPFHEALDVLDQMSRGLDAAHAQGIVHRDLKPSNTFLQQLRGEQLAVVKLLDFGLVQIADADGAEKTSSDAVIGTALYLSPEQARSPNVDGRTDIYALGVVAYELVLGQHPFPDARTATAALAAHLTETPPQPRTIWPEIPAALDLLMYSMLAKDPSYRPTLAQIRKVIASVRSPTTTAVHVMRAAIVPAEHSSPTSEPSLVQARPTPVVPVDEPRASRRVVVALGALVVLGVVIAAVVATSGTTSVGETARGTEEPRSATEIDASVAPTTNAASSIATDASVPVATPAAPVDASAVTPRSSVDPALPSVARARHDGGGAQKSEPTVVEPVLPTRATTTLDASVEPEKEATIETRPGDAAVEVDAAVTPAKTSPSPHRAPPTPAVKKPTSRDGTPPVPAAKKPPKRNVISDPFRKKETK